MYRNVPKNLSQNVGKCTKKTISKVIRVAKGTLDVILSQINKKIGDRFHFQWYRRRVNYQFFNYVTDKVNGSRVQPSLFGEDQRPDPGDGGNRAYWHVSWHLLTDMVVMLTNIKHYFKWGLVNICLDSRPICSHKGAFSSQDPRNLWLIMPCLFSG